MLKSNHTKEDWRIVQNHFILKTTAIMAGRKVIAELPDWRGTAFDRLTLKEAAANAKLIESAPELLKRLSDIIDAIDHGILKIDKDSLYYKYGKWAVLKATEQ